MRLFLLTLLLAVCVSGGILSGFGNKFKDLLTGEGKLGEKLKNATINGFKKVLNATKLLDIRRRLEKMKEKVKKTLQLTPEMMASLKERLAKLRPIKRDRVHEIGDSIDEINQNSEVGELLFQSDIVLTPEQADEIVEDIEEEVSGAKRTRRQAFKDSRYPNMTWMDGVNYYFHYSATPKVQLVFKKAVELWQKDTCINFKEDRTATSRIRVFVENGCWSYVGRLGKEQDLSLGRGCDTVGTATHELGHALGFYHTMARHDRDDYVTVNYDNIRGDLVSQFTKQTTKTNENYGIGYDFGSIMHYGGTSGSYNRKPTLVPMDTNYQETLGSRFIAFYDLLMLNTHYGCFDKCKKDSSAAVCENGGVPHPRDCRRCLCPNGYGGQLCNERPKSSCGATVQATSTYQDLVSVIGHEKKDEEVDFERCYYWIESPKGTQIEVRIDSIDGTYATDGCAYGGVEIKTQKDQKSTGYRFCSEADVDLSLVSKGNRVPIMTFSRFGKTEIKLQYRFVTDGKPGPKPQPVTSNFVGTRFSTPPGFRCKDNSSVCSIIKNTICDKASIVYDDAKRWSMCAKTCGLCQ